MDIFVFIKIKNHKGRWLAEPDVGGSTNWRIPLMGINPPWAISLQINLLDIIDNF